MVPGKNRRVVFVCIGNSCRSQMAEGFARTYGRDVMRAESAGLAPASIISPVTRAVMQEKNINLEDHFPKALHELDLADVDLVVNMSGYPLPSRLNKPVETWEVDDPIGEDQDFYRQVRDLIETRVMNLILRLRAFQDTPH